MYTGHTFGIRRGPTSNGGEYLCHEGHERLPHSIKVTLVQLANPTGKTPVID